MKRILLLCTGLLLLSACGKGSDETQVGTNQEDWTAKYEVAMPKGGAVVDTQHGKEDWFAIAPMIAVTEEPANGVTQAHYFADGSYLHNLKVNIARNEDGFFYEGWLAPSSDPSTWISLGHLHSNFGDTRHGVQFRADKDLREYLEVKVTREADDGDGLPGQVVVAGTLKVTDRPS